MSGTVSYWATTYSGNPLTKKEDKNIKQAHRHVMALKQDNINLNLVHDYSIDVIYIVRCGSLSP